MEIPEHDRSNVKDAKQTPPFTFESQEGTLVVILNAPSDSSINMLTEQIRAHEAKKVVVDLSNIQFAGNTLVTQLVSIWKTIRSCGGEMSLRGVSETNLEILHTMRFDTFWQIEGVTEASIGKG
ncbi:MAG: STAS domain-containing protein [Patescibacteria group bacterium]